MNGFAAINFFSQAGDHLLRTLILLSGFAGLLSLYSFCRRKPAWPSASGGLLLIINLLLISGFILICWFHCRIYLDLPLELPAPMADWLNHQLEIMNKRSAYTLPLYDAGSPPRYRIPLWIENEKYYFWFMIYGIMALFTYRRLENHRLRAVLQLFLTLKIIILFFFANPFIEPLKRFFLEIRPWFSPDTAPMQRLGIFMKLYPKMNFYYNAAYMWLHPPLLFISYAGITLTFIASCFMLIKQDFDVEKMAYDYAKLSYFMLTLGMLLGYPWALQAWGPNWWWDPKICSSIMMWVVFSTYLHTRLYTHRRGMWYFSAILGIICFVAMLFTFATSFFFPGEHTF